jgi:hypothetical protein
MLSSLQNFARDGVVHTAWICLHVKVAGQDDLSRCQLCHDVGSQSESVCVVRVSVRNLLTTAAGTIHISSDMDCPCSPAATGTTSAVQPWLKGYAR